FAMVRFRLADHENLSFFIRPNCKATSNPVFCTSAFKFACKEVKPVVAGKGSPTNWLSDRFLYQDKAKKILSSIKPNSSAASNFLLTSQAKSGLNKREGWSPIIP